MKNLVDFIIEAQIDDVYAIVDFTDAIQGVFNTKEEADDALKDFPEEAKAKIKKMKKSEVEEKK